MRECVTCNSNIDGERPCGVGRSHDIVQASLAAILSAPMAGGSYSPTPPRSNPKNRRTGLTLWPVSTRAVSMLSREEVGGVSAVQRYP